MVSHFDACDVVLRIFRSSTIPGAVPDISVKGLSVPYQGKMMAPWVNKVSQFCKDIAPEAIDLINELAIKRDDLRELGRKGKPTKGW